MTQTPAEQPGGQAEGRDAEIAETRSQLQELKEQFTSEQLEVELAQVEELLTQLNDPNVNLEKVKRSMAVLVTKATEESPEWVENLRGKTEQLSSAIKQAAAFLSDLGSGVLKTIAQFLKPGSLLAKILLSLSESDAAQAKHIEKALTAKIGPEKATGFFATLEKDRIAPELLTPLREQVRRIREAIAEKKMTQAYDFETHVEALVLKIDATQALTVAIITEKGAAVEQEQLEKIKTTEPPAAATNPPPAAAG